MQVSNIKFHMIQLIIKMNKKLFCNVRLNVKGNSYKCHIINNI